MHRLRTKRVYDAPATNDGIRVLVDRLWPRGLSKEQARLDHWLKEIAPSSALRLWFNHDDSRWQEFKRRYFDELATLDEQVAQLRKLLRGNPVTLLYSARSETHNNAVALAEFLRKWPSAARQRRTRSADPSS
jgi:uncharacterized protein YeaO (DUF488 family)